MLNHILTEKHGLKIAVIENEFGEVGVDDALLKNRKKLAGDEEVVEMNNGCICCTVRGDLIKFLTKLAKRPLDLVIIETTGLADPAPVAQTFFVDDDVRASFKLDSILTVVDCKHIMQHLNEEKPDGVENESVEQVAFADIILLNKTDLVEEEEKQTIRKKLLSINTGVKIFETQQSVIDPNLILNQNSFELDRILEMEPDFLKDQEHEHDQSVSSVGFVFDYDLELEKLQKLIGRLLEESGTDLYRYKGVLPIAGIDKRFVFQGVHMLFGGQFGQPWGNDKREGRFIFIGKNLDKQKLIKDFEDCKALPLRFEVGQTVWVSVQKDQFTRGTVMKQWDEGNAYRVKLDDEYGDEVWAPRDSDVFIRDSKRKRGDPEN